jgi:hypothetical protein
VGVRDSSHGPAVAASYALVSDRWLFVLRRDTLRA